MEVLTSLGDAENDLYSANFADYAGGGGTKVRNVDTVETRLVHDARPRSACGVRDATFGNLFFPYFPDPRRFQLGIPCR